MRADRTGHWLAATLAALAALVALAALPQPLGASDALPLPTGTWSCLETEQLRVYTDDSPKRLVELTTSLHRLDEVIAATTSGLRGRHSRPAVLIAFRNRDAFNRYSPSGAAGLFVPGDEAHYLLLNLAAENVPVETAHHEWTHLVLEDALPELQLWFNEGYAEYLSTFTAQGHRADIGRPIGHRLDVVAAMRRLIPVERLTSVTYGDPEYTLGSTKSYEFYAESWLLTHMLLQNPDTTVGSVERYLTLLRRGVAPDSAVHLAFPGIRSGELDARLAGYRRLPGLKYSKWEFNQSIPAPVPTIRAAETTEILDLLAECLRSQGGRRREFAKAHWDEALRVDPKFAPAAAGLGRLADDSGATSVADDYYRRAFAIDSTDARVCYRTASGWIRRSAEEMNKAPRWWEARLPRMRAAAGLLERALAVRPKDPAISSAYAAACLGNPDDSVLGLSAAADAIHAFPFRADLRVTEALLYAQAGSTSQARRVARDGIDPFLASDSEAGVYGRINAVDVHRAQDALSAGRAIDADSILARAAAETANQEARREVTDQRVERIVRYAQDLAKRGQADEARALLARIDPVLLSEEQKKNVSEAVTGLDAPPKPR